MFWDPIDTKLKQNPVLRSEPIKGWFYGKSDNLRGEYAEL
jgi:hypothetical protein